ncbi:hypothetical protein OD781_08985 [Pseudomonas aeruginosa]|nr:hypothetical protein [Pseudomonas aeruginosa]MCV4061268.1 hypothetical protein [Pseudomonas aeruginosa]MCV4077247.1 hypothetical protein [Pseudomonas aeruginosa]MCV4148682.1 hypothetical protein [Pseudomonas aeruginosa]MCV4180515.1 hypothetical protein [Pseudomonas aeruginosa]MCV4219978.1 hypothetical protein [Pseudomonas aeruginosa]
MYRPKREWAWDEQAEQEYLEKRAKLADKGYVNDEDVCRYFAENGVDGCEPTDIRPMMLDAITASPLERVLRSLQ